MKNIFKVGIGLVVGIAIGYFVNQHQNDKVIDYLEANCELKPMVIDSDLDK